eukprot:s262_g23.t2
MKLAELKELQGLQPPKLPEILAARKKPVLHQMKSELMSAIWQEEFNFQVTEEEVQEKPQLLFDRYQWKDDVRINAVEEAQHMERSAAQKAWDEKMRLRGKITDKDREWQRKKEDEKRQRALRHLHTYAKSLTGSDGMHHPIIKVKSEMAPEESQPREEKISKKQQDILDKNNAKKEEEKQAADAKQEKEWDKSVEALSQDGKDPAKLEKELLDLLIGFNRIMPSFVGFPALQVFKTSEAQVRIITKVVKNLKKVLEKMQLDKLAVELQPKVRSLVVYIYCLLQEAWNTYGRKRLLDGKCSGNPDLDLDESLRLVAQTRHRIEEEEFDEYAEEFEEHLVTVLDYKLPEVLLHKAQLLPRDLPRVVDLGCGTGLCGRALLSGCSSVGCLVGVDLSACMLSRAKQEGGYDELYQRDLLAHLQREGSGAVDLLLACDVFIYVSSLEKVLTEGHRVLRPGGFFFFSTEAATVEEAPEGLVQRASGRYAHSRDYVEGLMEGRFQILDAETIDLRIEDDLPSAFSKRLHLKKRLGCREIYTSLKATLTDLQDGVSQARLREEIDSIKGPLYSHGLLMLARRLHLVEERESIKLFQEVLISMGFPHNARGLFEEWKKVMQPEAEAAEPEAEAKDKDKKKGGKDDKKDKKKDGKDKKDDKKDQKGKKDDKKDDKDEDLDSFKVTKEVDLVWSGVGSDEYAFQLLHMGPQMTRLTGAQKDSRVNFSPDKWQRDLIDIVDNEESALVVAPTASGKTFIGYYVMDKVLRQDHQGVAVYVAPSKALVNQVSAEIYARFGKKIYPAHSKQELLGVFLKEFNSAGGVAEAGKWRNCQVLVTIPHILEMLLLSAEFQDWVAQLRYVIFDEVHCIGEQEGGEQWEHCMQLIPCPFIALSATVADPSIFHGWLSRVSEKKNTSKVSIVEHKERWNDLYKYVWHKGEMRPLHPFCCLVESSLRRNGMSADLTLVPREMVQLHQEVSKIVGRNSKWDRLAPAKYFAGMAFVTKIDSRKYEKELKASFLELLTENSLKSEGFTQLTLSLQQNPELEMGSFNPPPREEKAETDLRTLEKETSYLQAATLFKLCKDLDSRDIMPAIFFNFSRKEIERMLKKLVDELEKRQYDKYFGDEDAKYRTKKLNERRRAEYEQKRKAFEEAQKMKASAKQESKAARASGENEGRGGNKSEAADTSADLMMVEPVEPMDIADEIDDEFTFHSAKALGVGQEDIEEEISKAAKGCEKWMLVGLRRGIGMHHEGLKKNYKDAVEVLFRKGYLRVVFATGTLALGINMPCRSTIFCGDSLETGGWKAAGMERLAGTRKHGEIMEKIVISWEHEWEH